MSTESDIIQQIRDFLGQGVDARREDGFVRVLMPLEYPDGDSIVVRVEQADDGRYLISDGGDADATLIGQLGSRSLSAPAAQIAHRFEAAFDSGQLTAIVDDPVDLADGCLRVAQAAAAVAEAATYLRRQPRREIELVDVIAGQLREREIAVERGCKLEGASGHPHTATLFVPATETVIEPVGGERPWQVASAVYVEFGDLGKVNGYRLMSVLDDRKAEVGTDISGLLSQVSDVASWREHDSWITELGRCQPTHSGSSQSSGSGSQPKKSRSRKFDSAEPWLEACAHD